MWQLPLHFKGLKRISLTLYSTFDECKIDVVVWWARPMDCARKITISDTRKTTAILYAQNVSVSSVHDNAFREKYLKY